MNENNLSFIHLRVHSPYSVAKGAIHLKDMIAYCKEHNMPAIAVTDNNSCSATRYFSAMATSVGVQPIMGSELSLKIIVNKNGIDNAIFRPIVLLVQNETGWLSLLHLLKLMYMRDDNKNEPHITLDELLNNNAGLILLSGGSIGPIGYFVANNNIDYAKEILAKMQQSFAGRFYMELIRINANDEDLCEEFFIDYAYENNIPLVATNNSLFLNEQMHTSHDALLCIAEGVTLSVEDRARASKEQYLKTPKQMVELFSDLPEAVQNTVNIAKRCNFFIEARPPELPKFTSDDNIGENEQLIKAAQVGLEIKLKEQVLSDDMSEADRQEKITIYQKRLDYEIDVIINMGFSGYFLIVADFIGEAKRKGIMVGPGRGSGAGSLVAWCLSITDLDPLPLNLLFERFLNPERVSMPDFDIDFCRDRREEVIQYVYEKYGFDNVAQIITFGKLQAKAAIRDAGRVLEMPYGAVDSIAKLIPNDPKITIDKAKAEVFEFEAKLKENDANMLLHDIASNIEGLYRNAATHAAGIVIGARPLEQITPIYRDPRSSLPSTGYDMGCVEDTGLVKFDFLGLQTLTLIKKTLDLIKKSESLDIDISKIPFKDDKAFELLKEGDTIGVFQFESAGMQKVLIGMQPDCFEDLIAAVSLYRPGPMDQIPAYQARKLGKSQATYLHPWLEDILKETHGIMVYQEQVMQIAQKLAGYSLGNADLLRRAMGKKKASEMAKQENIFVSGAVEKGIDKAVAKKIFDLMAKFAEYGFNKSHAAAYALVSWQTAWLKAHYPVHFLAAAMEMDENNTDKLSIFKQDAIKHDIKILPPCINKSDAEFSVQFDENGNEAIRYSLAALKGVGKNHMYELVKERTQNGNFKNIDDFSQRVSNEYINKRTLERLIIAGALDDIHPYRKELIDSAENILSVISSSSEEKSSDQISFFDELVKTSNNERVKLVKKEESEFNAYEKLSNEIAAYGFFFSGHPIEIWTKEIKLMEATYWAELPELYQEFIHNLGTDDNSKNKVNEMPVRIACHLEKIIKRKTKDGSVMAICVFSDPSGSFEAVFFPKTYQEVVLDLEVGELFLLSARFSISQDEKRLIASSITNLDNAINKLSTGYRICIDSQNTLSALPKITKIVKDLKHGDNNLFLKIEDEDYYIEWRLASAITLEAKKLISIKDTAHVKQVEQIEKQQNIN